MRERERELTSSFEALEAVKQQERNAVKEEKKATTTAKRRKDEPATS